jgi:hypothetical protein
MPKLVPTTDSGLPSPRPLEPKRRALLAAIPATETPASPLADGRRPDADLFEIEAVIAVLLELSKAADEAYCAAETAYFSERPPKPILDFDDTNPEGSLRNYSAAKQTRDAACEALKIKYDVHALEDASERLGDEIDAAIIDLCSRQAKTLEGTKLQARMALFWEKDL